MANYPQLSGLLRTNPPAARQAAFLQNVLPYLIDVWLDDYYLSTPVSEIVEVEVSGFSYLFDIQAARLIAAWGVSTQRNSDPRPNARLRGLSLSAGQLYHRGHAISHLLGGACDINIVPQLGRVNTGAFQSLEREALANPGAFYFTYWSYAGAPPTQSGHPAQTPSRVDQGLLIDGQPPQITRHVN